ncbi:MAG: hypothetical protein ABWX96_15910 [Propionibacteriaceae bacterium]
MAILLVGVLVATVQILAEGGRRAERVRIYTLAALAAFFGGSLVKAITQEGLASVSFGSIAVAAFASFAVLYAWRTLARMPRPLPQRVGQRVGQR